MSAPPVLASVIRDGVIESVHRGHVAVARAEGGLHWGLGDPRLGVYLRSAAKPFQARAVLDLLAEAGLALPPESLAIACASHEGSHTHQVEAAQVLALAGLDESALRCPPALPTDLPTLLDQRIPTALAHNCSGKHAAFLLAHTATGGDPSGYLDVGSPLQQRVREQLAALSDGRPAGPGVDGCGAPAWRLPLQAVAGAFARLAAAADGPLAQVRAAMTTRPDLVGGRASPDTALMLADARVVAKRGAEGVLAAGFTGEHGRLGVAVKVADGNPRGAAPAVATVLRVLGARVPDALVAPEVLGGRVEVAPAVASCAARRNG